MNPQNIRPFFKRLLKKTLSKRVVFVLAVLFVGSVFLYPTEFIQWGMQKLSDKSKIGREVVKVVQSVYDPIINYTHITDQNELADAYYDLRLSVSDLEYLEERINYFADLGFIKDSENTWRGAEVLLDGKYRKVKFKLHGTSVSTLLVDRGYWTKQWQRLVYHWPALEGLIDLKLSIQNPYYSLKVKHKSRQGLYKSMREYHFKNPVDSADIETISINTMARDLGLIAPASSLKILRLNGTELGLYTLQETFSKENFERDFGITNYSIIKTTDDWDRRQGHITDYDTWVENQEIKTVGHQSNMALNSLDVLLTAVKEDRVDVVKRLVDLDYMAKFLAMHSIMNNNHPITGDNMKFVYDLSKGKFKIIFREEASITRIERGLNYFNKQLFQSVWQNVASHKLFKLLLSDDAFRKIRDDHLRDIIARQDYFIALFQKIFEDNRAAVFAYGKQATAKEYTLKYLIKDFKSNLNFANTYLTYNKVLVTERSRNENTLNLTVVNDSFTETVFDKVIMENENGNILEEKIDVTIPGLSFDVELNTKARNFPLTFTLKPGYRIKGFEFRKPGRSQAIAQKDIYFNQISIPEGSQISDSEVETLQSSPLKYEQDDTQKTITVQKGQYHLPQDVVFPYGYDVTLQPGTTLQLGENVSVIVQGGLQATGTAEQPIIVNRSVPDKPFASFSVITDKRDRVSLDHFKLSGGNETVKVGTYFSGQMSIHGADVRIRNSSFSDSSSDDGINIKYSKIDIASTAFFNNPGDQIDLDFCEGVFAENTLNSEIPDHKETDGLDLSGSKLLVRSNTFSGFTDKGISVGENTTVEIEENSISNNRSGISVKDGSVATLRSNQFSGNTNDLDVYVKKPFYEVPTVILSDQGKDIQVGEKDGNLRYQ